MFCMMSIRGRSDSEEEIAERILSELKADVGPTSKDKRCSNRLFLSGGIDSEGT